MQILQTGIDCTRAANSAVWIDEEEEEADSRIKYSSYYSLNNPVVTVQYIF